MGRSAPIKDPNVPVINNTSRLSYRHRETLTRRSRLSRWRRFFSRAFSAPRLLRATSRRSSAGNPRFRSRLSIWSAPSIFPSRESANGSGARPGAAAAAFLRVVATELSAAAESYGIAPKNWDKLIRIVNGAAPGTAPHSPPPCPVPIGRPGPKKRWANWTDSSAEPHRKKLGDRNSRGRLQTFVGRTAQFRRRGTAGKTGKRPDRRSLAKSPRRSQSSRGQLRPSKPKASRHARYWDSASDQILSQARSALEPTKHRNDAARQRGRPRRGS